MVNTPAARHRRTRRQPEPSGHHAQQTGETRPHRMTRPSTNPRTGRARIPARIPARRRKKGNDHDHQTTAQHGFTAHGRCKRHSTHTATSMSAGTCPVPGWLSFRRIVDVPFETCLAAVESWQRTGLDGDLRIGESRLRGPIEHDRDSGTRRIEVRLARRPLRPLLRMRLNIDRWSSSSTALDLIPCGRVRPTAAYFRAGHLLLDSLAHSLSQQLPAARARGTECPVHGRSACT